MLNLRMPISAKRWLYSAGVIIVIIILSYQVFGQPLKAVAVKTARVERQDLSRSLYVTGTLQAIKQEEYKSQVNATIKEARKGAGAWASAGEPLLLLDNTRELVQLGQAENNLSLLEFDYKQAVTDKATWVKRLDEARKKRDRIQRQYDVGSATLQQLDESKLELMIMEEQAKSIDLPSMEEQIKKARAAVDAARAALAATVITSPADGMVTKMLTKTGLIVTKGMPLFSIAKLNSLEVVCTAKKDETAKLSIGQTVDLHTGSIRGIRIKAHISKIEDFGNTVKIRLIPDEKISEQVEEKDGNLTINVIFPIPHITGAIVVPPQAVAERDGKSVVFLYRNGLVEMQEVSKGLTTDLYQEITAGLSEGDNVILSPPDTLKDKSKVKLEE